MCELITRRNLWWHKYVFFLHLLCFASQRRRLRRNYPQLHRARKESDSMLLLLLHLRSPLRRILYTCFTGPGICIAYAFKRLLGCRSIRKNEIQPGLICSHVRDVAVLQHGNVVGPFVGLALPPLAPLCPTAVLTRWSAVLHNPNPPPIPTSFSLTGVCVCV